MLLQQLQLGFELDLYAPEEYCMLFWWASCSMLQLCTLQTFTNCAGSALK